MKENLEVRNTLNSKFILIEVCNGKENEFDKTYGPNMNEYPYLSIVSSDGKFIIGLNTGVLEEGKGYNQEKVLKFLNGGIITKDGCSSNWN